MSCAYNLVAGAESQTVLHVENASMWVIASFTFEPLVIESVFVERVV